MLDHPIPEGPLRTKILPPLTQEEKVASGSKEVLAPRPASVATTLMTNLGVLFSRFIQCSPCSHPRAQTPLTSHSDGVPLKTIANRGQDT